MILHKNDELLLFLKKQGEAFAHKVYIWGNHGRCCDDIEDLSLSVLLLVVSRLEVIRLFLLRIGPTISCQSA
jgi:hypothetical protein